MAHGPSEGRWAWGASLGVTTAHFVASGYAIAPDQARTQIARSFRQMLARADLRERVDARPGPPHRQAQAPDGLSGRLRPEDREKDRLLGPMLRNKRCITIRSGELIVGLLACSTHGEETWSWILSAVGRPFEDFVWHGDAANDRTALDALAAAWLIWTRWARLEPVETLQRGARRSWGG